MTLEEKIYSLADILRLPPTELGEWVVFVHLEFQESMERIMTEEIQIGQAPGL